MQEANKMFVIFDLSKLKNNSDQPQDQEFPAAVPNVQTCTVINILIVQQTQFPTIKNRSKNG